MTTPTFEVGQKLTAGLLLRYVPNWFTHWDEEINRPRTRAFRRRKNEKSVSMFLEGANPNELGPCETSVERLHRILPEFAICRVSVEEMLEGTGAWVEYQPADDVPEGHAHFEIFELPKGRTAALADALAEIVQPPGPIKPPDNPVRGDATQ